MAEYVNRESSSFVAYLDDNIQFEYNEPILHALVKREMKRGGVNSSQLTFDEAVISQEQRKFEVSYFLIMDDEDPLEFKVCGNINEFGLLDITYSGWGDSNEIDELVNTEEALVLVAC
jgi:hypothetical protein